MIRWFNRSTIKNGKKKTNFPNTYQKSFGKSLTKKAWFVCQIYPINIHLWCRQLQHRPEKTFRQHSSNIHCHTPNSIPISKCCPNCQSYHNPTQCIWIDLLYFEPALPFINRIHKACFRTNFFVDWTNIVMSVFFLSKTSAMYRKIKQTKKKHITTKNPIDITNICVFEMWFQLWFAMWQLFWDWLIFRHSLWSMWLKSAGRLHQNVLSAAFKREEKYREKMHERI